MKRYPPILILMVTLLAMYASSCKPSPEEIERDIINEWIWEGMNDVYYWYDDLDQNAYPTELEPQEFFNHILIPEDRFSWIVDDYQELMDRFASIEISNGISPYFIRVASSNKVLVIVEYVVAGSPADKAGIQRGDIITTINGSEITIDNYADLFYTDTTKLEFADYIDGSIRSNGVEITIIAKQIEENPILHYELIDYGGHEIAYLVYNHFSVGKDDRWLDSLDLQMAEIQSAAVDALIIDIRYNPGGSIFMANHLASALCPASVPGNDNVFVFLQWNDLLEEYFIANDGEDSERLVSYFEDSPALNLDLNEIYLLTSSRSASASELLIIGLEPYMDVIHLGDTTYGKGYGSITVDDWEEPKRHEWAMQPITFKFANGLGAGVPFDGISPDYYVEDFLLEAKPFGDMSDPQLARALSLITGLSPNVKKSNPLHLQYDVLPDPVRKLKNKASLVLPAGQWENVALRR